MVSRPTTRFEENLAGPGVLSADEWHVADADLGDVDLGDADLADADLADADLADADFVDADFVDRAVRRSECR
ncbi:pentapeptide repeat-containing protein [Mycobacterium sp. THU-M104]